MRVNKNINQHMDTLDNQSFNTEGGLTPEVDHEIAAMAPWMRLMAILQIVSLAIGLLTNIVTASMFPYRPSGPFNSGIVGAVIGIVIIIMPIIFLLQSANAFKHYAATKDRTSLLLALTKQKAFWRYMGILAIVYLALVLIGIIFVAAIGGSMFGSRF